MYLCNIINTDLEVRSTVVAGGLRRRRKFPDLHCAYSTGLDKYQYQIPIILVSLNKKQITTSKLIFLKESNILYNVNSIHILTKMMNRHMNSHQSILLITNIAWAIAR